ncbi:hypothetical protein [Mongoliitalea lutea]|uniref:Uncharacterized protein n=1 Tax=Mongoliitalea lutea TaxID=849756 RepID=A0A8J3G4B7_9BACT|nr:hypothetical protein [Mongoliitalea lutea]GHB28411.1 hypothetical protein GCM10008106_06300 [Mongoliitalea lutea]
MEIYFTIGFLLSIYFLTSLALSQGFFPYSKTFIQDKKGEIKPIFYYGRIMLISLLISISLTALMFYFFISPANFLP